MGCCLKSVYKLQRLGSSMVGGAGPICDCEQISHSLGGPRLPVLTGPEIMKGFENWEPIPPYCGGQLFCCT